MHRKSQASHCQRKLKSIQKEIYLFAKQQFISKDDMSF